MLSCDLCSHWNAWISYLDDVSLFDAFLIYDASICLDDASYLVGTSIALLL